MYLNDFKKKYIKAIHFIGIGGIGMSALALIFKEIGCKIQGSDLKKSKNIIRLEEKGIKCFIGHDSDCINEDVDLVVKTSLIKDNNPEIISAKEKNITILRRSDLLSLLTRGSKTPITVAGTHGKTSTVAMIAAMLEAAKFDPLVINGGIMNLYNTNSKVGYGDFSVAETDESDGSFVDLPTKIGVITNIEPEHLEFYNNDFERVKDYYRKYVEQISVLCILCIDDPLLEEIYISLRDTHNITTYSINNESADIIAKNMLQADERGSRFDVVIKKSNKVIKNLTMPIYGTHNILNSLSVIAIADFLSLQEDIIRKAFNGFLGVKRRFTKVAEIYGITIIDDYAHHPTEIKFISNLAKELAKNNKVIMVFQPHKYNRLSSLFKQFSKSFNEVDLLLISDVYSVNEDNETYGVSQDELVEAIIENGQSNIIKLKNKSDIAKIIRDSASEGDIVIYAGAGDITNWAYELPEELKKIY